MEHRDKYLIMGIGNPNMGDDAIGIEIVNNIKNKDKGIETEILFYISFEILDKILGYEHVIIIDAADIGLVYGQWKFLSYMDLSQNMYIKNSHGITLFHVLKTGYEIFENKMPKELDIVLIQTGKITDFEEGINPDLKAHIPYITKEIFDKLLAKTGGQDAG